MSDRTRTGDAESPAALIRSALRQAWRDALSVYYANTPIWRLLKSGALLFLGFFVWSGSNLLLSYQPGWWWLTYPMAYGFVLLLWGPLTHLAVVPTAIRWRRGAEHPTARWLARHASKLNLSVFFAVVLVLGTFPVAPMTLDFAGAIGDGGSADVDPELECNPTGDVVACQLSDSAGYDHVVVLSDGEEIVRADEPPFAFEVPVSEMDESVNGPRITVELRTGDGETVRRYIRTFPGA